MRVFAVSDLHADYAENRDWVNQLSGADYRDDVLILAGDVTDNFTILGEVLRELRGKFRELLFVPGNHELWVQDDTTDCSLKKFAMINHLCDSEGVRRSVWHCGEISFVPLHSWYDFSFGEPDRHLRRAWRDFRACSWPAHLDDAAAINRHFLNMNESVLQTQNETVISFSHFLPRIDVMSPRIPEERRRVYPVLGSEGLGAQVRALKPAIHVYGHSHVNQSIEIDSIRYVNNAFAYPKEDRIARKELHCIYGDRHGS